MDDDSGARGFRHHRGPCLCADGAAREDELCPRRHNRAFRHDHVADGRGQPGIEKEHSDLLAERYDLADRPAPGITMSRGKPVQGGVRVKLPQAATWDSLAALTPDQIRDGTCSRTDSIRFRTPTTPRAAWCSRI
jgi:hypothetical protein